ncbi:hypothetical protein [Sphingomonas sp. G-3-2-10]|uniref:hypothetical protein n=1 Tax=Sphingomonas sp. G-3-2-10 TaxID=2728838 RepID=UPI00146DB8F3|nr:hypothetical protein [Sphingomonas sp. G-3-2-10]NML05286.1 hypothetical protein [Sphingomonas sp. G-3-2-10]
MIRTACILAGIALAAPAQAQDWRFLDKESGGGAVFLDAKSVVPGDDGVRTADLAMIYPESRDGVDAFRFRMTVDCTQPRFRTEFIWLYDASGKQTGSGAGTRTWTPTSGANGLKTSDIICERQAAPAKSYGSEIPIAEGRAMKVQ